jgi:hypothetical protein
MSEQGVAHCALGISNNGIILLFLQQSLDWFARTHKRLILHGSLIYTTLTKRRTYLYPGDGNHLDLEVTISLFRQNSLSQ